MTLCSLTFLISMLTERGTPLALFLFAHQDDEFGVFARIEKELRSGRRVFCAYLTDGAAAAKAGLREEESRAVLQKLGVPHSDILFIGTPLHWADCQLYLHMGGLSNWLHGFMDVHPDTDICFVPAWEGGHPDHDVLHAITVEVMLARKNPVAIWQYPLYNGRNCPGLFFRVLSPIPENGPVDREPIAWCDRLRYIRLCLAYPSQWRSWVGLFPFAFFHYFWCGVQQLQKVEKSRLSEPPHARPLYYERRAFLDWSVLSAALASYRNDSTAPDLE